MGWKLATFHLTVGEAFEIPFDGVRDGLPLKVRPVVLLDEVLRDAVGSEVLAPATAIDVPMLRHRITRKKGPEVSVHVPMDVDPGRRAAHAFEAVPVVTGLCWREREVPPFQYVDPPATRDR